MSTGALQLLQRCVDADVALAAGDPRRPAALFPGEDQVICRAVPKRRNEFSVGRALARTAMVQLGVPAQPILAGQDRAPIWPEGITGSISHCDEACIAAVARTADVRAIGIDLEPKTPLAADLIDILCTPQEQAWLAGQNEPGLLAKVIFCAKEAAYKAQYQVTGELFGFERFIAKLECTSGKFQVRFTQTTGAFEKGHVIEGRFACDAEFIVASLILR